MLNNAEFTVVPELSEGEIPEGYKRIHTNTILNAGPFARRAFRKAFEFYGITDVTEHRSLFFSDFFFSYEDRRRWLAVQRYAQLKGYLA